MPEFYVILPEKFKSSRILHNICHKMPEFYTKISQKYLFPNFCGGNESPSPTPTGDNGGNSSPQKSKIVAKFIFHPELRWGDNSRPSGLMQGRI